MLSKEKLLQNYADKRQDYYETLGQEDQDQNEGYCENQDHEDNGK